MFHQFSSICERLDAAAFSAGASQASSIPGVPRAELYNYKELKQRGLLILKSAEPPGGIDRRVAIVLGEHRQKDDISWEGEMCFKNLLRIALSRASERCHFLLEDLRGCYGALRRRSSAGGQYRLQHASWKIRRGSGNEHSLLEDKSRRQMPWVRLCALAAMVVERAARDACSQTHPRPGRLVY